MEGFTYSWCKDGFPQPFSIGEEKKENIILSKWFRTFQKDSLQHQQYKLKLLHNKRNSRLITTNQVSGPKNKAQ